MNLEKELSDINNRILKKETNFWWASDLYYDAKQKYFSADKKELTDKCAELAASIFFFFCCKDEGLLLRISKWRIHSWFKKFKQIRGQFRRNFQKCRAS